MSNISVLKDNNVMTDEELAESLERGVRDIAREAAREDREASADSIAESLRRGTQNVMRSLESKRDQRLDSLNAQLKLRQDGYSRDIADTRAMLEDLQRQIATHTERLKHLEEVKHIDHVNMTDLIRGEQKRFKQIIDAHRHALTALE